MTTKSTKNTKKIAQRIAQNYTEKRDVLDIFNDYFSRRKTVLLFLGLGTALLFSLLLFDIKVSPGGDDSAYITRAFELVHGFLYPGFQGPLYPFVLSVFIFFGGINLLILKLFSLVCILVSLWLFYKTLSGKLPQTIVSITYMLLCINYSLLYYASQTYSEAFYLMLQSLFFWYAVKNFTGESLEKTSLKQFMILGLMAFLLTLTRNIAWAAVIAVTCYFIFTSTWKSGVKFLSGVTLSFLLFAGLKLILWGHSGSQFANQASAIKYKNFYNPAMGNEDFSGYFNRFIDNSTSFFSTHIFNFMGLRMDIIDGNTLLMISVWAILIYALYTGLKHNKLLLLISSYTIAMCVMSFFAVQKDWNQSRMIIIYLPFFLILFFAVLYELLKNFRFKIVQLIIPVAGMILFFSSFAVSGKNMGQQKEIIDHNMRGDILYGLSPDWKNYIRMSQWAARNTPGEYYTAVRKPDISFIYTERKFYGITKVPAITADSLSKIITGHLQYVGIQMNDLVKISIYKNPKFRSKLVSVVNGKFRFGKIMSDNSIVGIFGFTHEEFNSYEPELQANNVYYEPDSKPLVENLRHNTDDFGIFLPDTLYHLLQKEKIKYLLLASLRTDPTQKTDRIISTIHRMVYYIQLKYPDKFFVRQTIGTDEKAQLVEIKF